MKKISFYTLGCKLNQAETAILAEQFEQKGYQLKSFGEEVDICVINTCTVTGKSDYRCRQMIRKAKKISPDAQIAVVGCYAQLSPDKIEKIDGVDFILGSDKKFDLIEMIDGQNKINHPLFEASANDTFFSPSPGNFWDHTRAFLKIQDGCDSFCSYCTVPLARGRSRSDSLDHILTNANELVARGHQEIVLTGVHIGKYGKDFKPPQSLLDVLKALEKISDLKRIRLSSLEPLEIDRSLIQWIADSKKVCHHFHIPLQSGDDEILKQMNRNYSSSNYSDIVLQVKDLMPDCGLGTDVIVGFPGESQDHFENTVRLVERLPFTYLHVFSYSPRPGTKAFRLKDRVHPNEIKQRSEILRKVGKKKKQTFLQDLVGQKLQVLWEEKQKGSLMFGLTGNYARVRTQVVPELMNKICLAEISKAENDFVDGKIIDKIDELIL
ncbi:MAG: tRNA (N(6)-L-threonylcarbamoyladenosine(37)-C(2))-methylthiotransferase MtaB [bacterium]|nr:tRNA (N(6)-L-threonylcarbamoyladenosine(37)-C(2))-methylthiotransferase MtaB [bacterium]